MSYAPETLRTSQVWPFVISTVLGPDGFYQTSAYNEYTGQSGFHTGIPIIRSRRRERAQIDHERARTTALRMSDVYRRSAAGSAQLRARARLERMYAEHAGPAAA